MRWTPSKRTVPLMALKYRKNTKGYLIARLWKEGVVYQRPVHSLVCEAFIGPKPDGHEINHKDGIKAHNGVENLEYCTRSENAAHAIALGLRTPNPVRHVTRGERFFLRMAD